MYSPDRKQALETMISVLKEMPLYDQCQKTLVVDQKTNIVLSDWKQIEVPRINNEFCWAHMWDAGVATAQFEKIVYLDSDRMLPPCFLELMNQNIIDDAFVFTFYHFMMKQELNKEHIKNILHKLLSGTDLQQFDEYKNLLIFEPRFKDPVHKSGKNVMSGSTGFTKKTYYRLGGVDPWYRGHGAFADTDFHFLASQSCEFIDLGIPELHYPHQKKENNQNLNVHELRRMALNNFIYYCVKWGLPSALAETMALGCNLKYPSRYVEKKVQELKQMPWDS
jgi:hypothetical protein